MQALQGDSKSHTLLKPAMARIEHDNGISQILLPGNHLEEIQITSAQGRWQVLLSKKLSGRVRSDPGNNRKVSGSDDTHCNSSTQRQWQEGQV